MRSTAARAESTAACSVVESDSARLLRAASDDLGGTLNERDTIASMASDSWVAPERKGVGGIARAAAASWYRREAMVVTIVTKLTGSTSLRPTSSERVEHHRGKVEGNRIT